MKTVRWGRGGDAAVLVCGGFNRSALDFAPLSLRNARRCFAGVLEREEAVIRAAHRLRAAGRHSTAGASRSGDGGKSEVRPISRTRILLGNRVLATKNLEEPSFAVELEDVGEARVAGAGIGEDAANGDRIIRLFENQFVREMAGIANGERDARLDGDLNRAVEGVVAVSQRIVDGFTNELVGIFGDKGAAGRG